MNVKTQCSGTLTMGAATGYEIRKTFEKGPFAAFYDAGYGSNYPALWCLLNEDLATVEEEVQLGKLAKKSLKLDTGSSSAIQARVGWPQGSLVASGLGVEFCSLPAKYHSIAATDIFVTTLRMQMKRPWRQLNDC